MKVESKRNKHFVALIHPFLPLYLKIIFCFVLSYLKLEQFLRSFNLEEEKVLSEALYVYLSLFLLHLEKMF